MQVARDRRHVDGDEGAGLAQAVVVQRAGDQLLAGAALAGDHHAEVGVHQPREDAVDLLHRRRAADQRQVVLAAGVLLLGLRRAARLVVQRLGDLPQHLLEVEGLRQVLVGADLGGADRGHHRVLRAHHDDRQVGPPLPDRRQQVERVAVGHHHVGDDDVALALLDPAPERRRGAGGAHPAAGAGQRLGEDGADGAVVVGDEDRAFHASPPLRVVDLAAPDRQPHPEPRPPRPAVAFDHAAVVGDELRDQRQAEAGAVDLGADEGVEDVADQVLRDARAVVGDGDEERQALARLPGPGHLHPGPVGGGDRDGAAHARHRLGGVLEQVLEHLQQLVGVAGRRRQRRVELLGEARVRGEAGLGGAAGAVEHVVDVERLALRGAQVAELLDPVDQLADARRLGLDQAGQLAVGVAEGHLEELRRAGDAGERVADLVRQHRRHAGDRARRRAVAEAAVHLLGHALRVHQDQDLAAGVLQRRGVHVLQLRRLVGPADHDVVLRHRDAVAPRLARPRRAPRCRRRGTSPSGRPAICRCEVPPKLSVAGLAVTMVSVSSTTSAG